MKNKELLSLSIIIPAYNEELSIGATIIEYKRVFPHARFVVVDNNSTDATYDEARKLLDLSSDILISEKKQGKGYAVKSALSSIEADIYVLTDADQTYLAVDAKKLLYTMLETRADMISGDRISSGTYADVNKRRGHSLGNKFLTWTISKLAGQSFVDVLSGLRVMSRPFVDKLDISSDGFQLETELNVIAAYLKVDIREVPISYRARVENSSSKLKTIKDGIRIFKFSIESWLTFAPMQFFSIISFLMFCFSFGLSFRVISGFLETGLSYATTATAAAASGFIAVLSIFIGFSLKIIVRNLRRNQIAQFVCDKRKWNSSLDEKQL